MCKVICFTVNVVIRIFEKDMSIPYLADLYGAVLSDRKRELLDYYYNEDYSLAEIAEITGISRQGIRESVKKSEVELRALEDALHLAARIHQLDEKRRELQKTLTALSKTPEAAPVRDTLKQILEAIDTLSF